MSQWEGKSKGTPTGYRIFVFLIKVFGLRTAYFVLYFVAFYYYFFSINSSKNIYYFYRHRMGFNFFKSLKMLYKNYYVFGQTLIDKTAVIANLIGNYSFQFTGENYLREIVQKGKGGILLSAHIGNWEAAGHLLKRLETRIHILMFDGEDPKIKSYIESMKSARSFNIILVKEDLSHIYKISEALASNELVCIHADRFLTKNKTISAKFLGKKTFFPEGPFQLALKFGVPVAFVYAFKADLLKYHFYSSNIKYYSKRDGHSIETVLNDYLYDLEEKLRVYPEQWFNYYKFWN